MLGDVYLSDNLADAAQAWNEWRKEVVDYAVRDKVVPALLQVGSELAEASVCRSVRYPLDVGTGTKRPGRMWVLSKRVLGRV